MKAEIAKKPSHGKRDLQAVMVDIELASLVPEGQERFDSRPAETPESRLRLAKG